MNALKTIALTLCLASSVASALPCDGYQVIIKNNLSHSLMASTLKLDNANLVPGGLQKIYKKSEKALTVVNSGKVVMFGSISLHSLSLPSHTIKVNYTLENKDSYCVFKTTVTEGFYSVGSSVLPEQALFIIEQ